VQIVAGPYQELGFRSRALTLQDPQHGDQAWHPMCTPYSTLPRLQSVRMKTIRMSCGKESGCSEALHDRVTTNSNSPTPSHTYFLIMYLYALLIRDTASCCMLPLVTSVYVLPLKLLLVDLTGGSPSHFFLTPLFVLRLVSLAISPKLVPATNHTSLAAWVL
jgi:hypothetical protein